MLVRAPDARFSAPVYPGDEIVTDIWRDGDGVLAKYSHSSVFR